MLAKRRPLLDLLRKARAASSNEILDDDDGGDDDDERARENIPEEAEVEGTMRVRRLCSPALNTLDTDELDEGR